jgi:hypothetical protein
MLQHNIMSLMKICHMFCNLSSVLLSQCNSSTKEVVRDGFQDCPQTNIGEVKETISDWLNGLVADFYDEGFVKHVQCLHMPESQWDYAEK